MLNTSGLYALFFSALGIRNQIKMDGDGFIMELLYRAIKYLIEGLAIAVAAIFIPRKSLPMDEVITLAVVAAGVFAILDFFAPSIGMSARSGAGYGLGFNLVGFPGAKL